MPLPTTLLLVFGGLTAWTVLILTTPIFRFDVSWPRARVPLETSGAVVASLTAGLAYLWYSFTGSRRTLVIAVAFVAVATNQILFGVIAGSDPFGLFGEIRVYFWTVGRLVAVGLLIAGAFSSPRPEERPRHPLLSFAITGALIVLLLLLIHSVLWHFKAELPRLSAAGPSVDSTGPLAGLTPTDIALGSVGAILYFLAAYLYLPSRRTAAREPRGIWLSVGLVVAGFSHLHYIFFPTVFSDRISTGDLLRLGFSAVLFVGLLWEVRLLSIAERDARLEIERLSRDRADLSRFLTHDVLQSIASLRTIAVFLSGRWPELNDETRERTAELLEHETAHLRDLADRTMALLELEQDTLPLERQLHRARDLVGEINRAARDMNDRVRLTIPEADGEALLMVDGTRMRQVFDNLLTNAKKYSTPGTPIDVSLRSTEHEVIFSITNLGAGIPEEHRTSIFERNGRLEANSNVAGWGLGLYISRTIVEAHGGRIWAASNLGADTTIAFSLPRVAETELWTPADRALEGVPAQVEGRGEVSR